MSNQDPLLYQPIIEWLVGERRELNPRMVDSQSTALIHLATSAPFPIFDFFKKKLFIISSLLPLINS